MAARLLPGAPVSEAVFADLAPRIKTLVDSGRTPGLATILVGNESASAGYVRMKQEKAIELGFSSPHAHLDDDATQAELLDTIARFNADPTVDAMLVQHPTPPPIDYEAALLAHYEINVAGRNVCILGRGTTLGRPLALLLSQKRPTANAAVTVVHTGVDDWPAYTRRADIVVAAAGVPGILQPEHLTPGVVVIGGGVRYEGRKLLPDVDERCEEVAGAITPRLGGVGPTTIAMLFRNAVEAAERSGVR